MNTRATEPRLAGRFASTLNDDRGLSTVEYVVLLVLLVGASVSLWVIFGRSIHDKLTQVNSTFEQVTFEPGGGQASTPCGNTRPLTNNPASVPAANNPGPGFVTSPGEGPAAKTKVGY